MNAKRNQFRKFRRAALGLFLSALSALSPATAAESAGHGNMAITFHNKRVNRSKSGSYYVVKDGGQVRWQNYADRRDDRNDPKKVYLVTDKSPQALSKPAPIEKTARR